MPNILKINVVSEKDYLEVDQISNESLEIFRKKNGEKKGSLIDILDRTMSSGGARMLRNQIKMPLKCSKKIENYSFSNVVTDLGHNFGYNRLSL